MFNSEIEVSISDLLVMLLKRIKLILCIAVLLGLVGAAYGAYSIMNATVTQADVDSLERRLDTAESRLATAQKFLSFRDATMFPMIDRKIERAERTIGQLHEYMENSIYFNMDPCHCGTARLRFTVETDHTTAQDTAIPAEGPRVGVVAAYTQMCPFDSETMEQVRSILSVETSLNYVEELISVTSDDHCHVVEICIRFDDLQKAEQAVNYLYQTMTARAKDSLPDHQTYVLATFTGYETDLDMSNAHAMQELSLTTAEETLTAANKSLQNLQSDTTKEQAVRSAAYEFDLAKAAFEIAQEDYSESRSSSQIIAKRIIKYGLLGVFVGIVFACCLVWILGLFSGIIQNQSIITHRYSFPLIGILPNAKRVWFDKAIRKLEGEPTGNYEAVAQATVQSLLARIGEKSVCLVSSSSTAAAKKIAAATGDRVHVIGSIIDNADTVKELDNYETIVLVEERGKSRINLVDAEVHRAKALNKEIIGIVLA